MASNSPELNRLYQKAHRARMTPEQRKAFDQHRYTRHRLKYAINSRNWARTHPEALQANTHTSTMKARAPSAITVNSPTNKQLRVWLEEHNKAGTLCRYCGDKATSIDHIVPVSKGGLHEFNNMQYLCKPCNSSKWDMSHDEYVSWLIKRLRYIDKIP